MKRHDPGVQFAASAVAQGRIGTILSVSAWYRVMSALRHPTELALYPPMVVDPEVRRRESELKQGGGGDTRETRHLVTQGDIRALSVSSGGDGL